jgi:DNA polymerase III delta prime subunit
MKMNELTEEQYEALERDESRAITISERLPADVARAMKLDPFAGILRQWSADTAKTAAYTSIKEVMQDIWNGPQADALEGALLNLTRMTMAGEHGAAMQFAERVQSLIAEQYVSEQAEHIGTHHWE